MMGDRGRPTSDGRRVRRRLPGTAAAAGSLEAASSVDAGGSLGSRRRGEDVRLVGGSA